MQLIDIASFLCYAGSVSVCSLGSAGASVAPVTSTEEVKKMSVVPQPTPTQGEQCL